MAKYHVLGIGYDYDYYSLATAKWTNYDIEFDFADSFAQAKALLSIKDYLCIAIVTDLIPQNELQGFKSLTQKRENIFFIALTQYKGHQRDTYHKAGRCPFGIFVDWFGCEDEL